MIKPHTLLGATLLSSFTLASAFAQEMTAERYQANLKPLLETMQNVIDKGPYKPSVDSFDKYAAPDWYADAKLGIFIHYGLFSVPGFSGLGCWYGNRMYLQNNGVNQFHVQEYGPLDQFGYKDFAPHLTASNFNADEWANLFSEAGARFVVPVTCFHDGFAMWNSKLTDWNAVKTGPKRDYLGLLAEASRKREMKFGVAWHAFFRPWFFATGRRPGTDIQPPFSGTPWSFYGPDKVTPEFVQDGLGRLVEIVDGYRPDLVWFDMDSVWVNPAELRKFASFYYNRAAEWGKGVAINDKNEDPGYAAEERKKLPPDIKYDESPFPENAVVLDYERGKSAGIRPKLWQTDTSVSWRDWSYIRNDQFKTVDQIVHELVDIVSKNGVLLLNVGPRPDGSIPHEPQAVLRGLGAWLKVNGEAIYQTRPCWTLGFGEGANNSGGGGFSDRSLDYSAQDFRFTQKGNKIYAIALKWPDVKDHFLVRSINTRTIVSTGGISGVRMLGSDEKLDWKLTDEGLRIQRPKAPPCYGAVAMEIGFSGVTLEKLGVEKLGAGKVRLTARLRNFDKMKTDEQKVEFFANGKVIGSTTFQLGPQETVTRTLDCDIAEAAATLPKPIGWDDFENARFAEHWKVEGEAFAGGPLEAQAVKFSQPVSGVQGMRFASSLPKEGQENLQGTLISKPFIIERERLLFSMAGGHYRNKACVNLKVDGNVVLSETGFSTNVLRTVDWDLTKWRGKQAVLEILDAQTGKWGFVHADHFRFLDSLRITASLRDQKPFANQCQVTPNWESPLK